MSPLKATTLWLLYSLGALALAHPDSNDTKLKTLTLPDNNNPGTKILNRRASDDEFCTDGGCAACFGSVCLLRTRRGPLPLNSSPPVNERGNESNVIESI
jgi:hypothetical protein